ncbi:MAG: hypothetical protein OXH75_18410, partial [Acidobacteria bacterium]|nr:hypothetical protein [Acidobacteriota bacterium]
RLLAHRRKRHDRLRWLLSLLLAMTVAGCLALAAGQAAWLQPGGGDRIALAFDSSPTMSASLPDGAGTRMDLAVAEARRIVAEADTGSRFTLGADPTRLTPAGALLALAGSFETDEAEGGGHQPAIPAADTAYLFTDGVSDWRPIIDPGTATHTVSILAPARNAGIVHFVTRPAPSHDAKLEALIEVLATDADGATGLVPVELTIADVETIRIRRQLELPPGNRFTALIDIGGFAPGPVTASLRTPGDVFPLDDRATLVDARKTGSARRVPPNGQRRVSVHTRSRTSFSDSAAAHALEADLSVEVVAVQAETAETGTQPAPAASGDADAAATPGPVDIAVFHRTAPTQLPALPSLFLAPPEALAAGGLSPAEAAPLSQRRIDRVAAEHPILNGVSLLGLPVTIASRQLDPRCTPVAAAGNLPAIAVCDPTDPASMPADPEPPGPDLTARSVVIAFDLDLSPLSQRPDLAALFQNTSEWLVRPPTDRDDNTPIGLQDERATRINDSDLDPVPPGRLAELTQETRRPWSWRTLALAGLLLASLEAITFFRGITV